MQSEEASKAAMAASRAETESLAQMAELVAQLGVFKDELKNAEEVAAGKIKVLQKEKHELEAELKDCRKKQSDVALDLEEAMTAVKAMHASICKQGPAAPQGGIGVALGSESVRVKGNGNPVKMYKVMLSRVSTDVSSF